MNINDVESKCASNDNLDLSDIEKERTESNVILLEQGQYAFAEGLPEWSIEPPQTVIRRIVRK